MGFLAQNGVTVPDFARTRMHASPVHAPGPLRQRGASLLEVSMVLGVAVILFALAVSVFENWEIFDLKVFVVEATREKTVRQVPVVAAAVSRWYLHEYCGQGAVDNWKPQLPAGQILACDALPLPPRPRPGLDSFTDNEPPWRNLADHLPSADTTLGRQDHGYTWEIYRPELDPNDMQEITVCQETAMSGVSDCRQETVPRGPPAMIEIAWSPPASEGLTIEDLEKLADAVGGTYARARSVPGHEVNDLASRAIGRTRLPDGDIPEVGAGGVECMRQARSRERVRFPAVPTMTTPQRRSHLRRIWSALWTGSEVLPVDRRPRAYRYDANSDGRISEADYLLWGC